MPLQQKISFSLPSLNFLFEYTFTARSSLRMSTQDENSLQELYEKRIVSRRVTLWQKYKENNGSSQSDGFSDTNITSQALETELKRVADSHATLLADRQSGPHVGATNIQLFAGTLLDFLKGYSAIFGVAQSVDNQFSG
tara:strand:+ start:93 stop:509 length:417 start_codon:yes stop_codon:yes gene_type:complete